MKNKKIYFKIFIVLIFVTFLLFIWFKANDKSEAEAGQGEESYQLIDKYLQDLQKREVVLLYPEGQEDDVENVIAKINKIYEPAEDRLIINKQKYDINSCRNNILADIELKGGLEYKSLVIIWTNSDMCEHIKVGIQNTGALVKRDSRYVRQTVITIPIEEETAQNLNEWKQDKEDWCNYRYAENSSVAVNQIYENLNVTEDLVDKVNNLIKIQVIDTPSVIPMDGEETVIEPSKEPIIEKVEETELKKVICSNGDIEVNFIVEGWKVVLSNGMTIKPNEVKVDDTLRVLYLNKEIMHGATVYVQYLITITNKIEDENITISDLNLEYDLNDSQYDSYCELLDEGHEGQTNLDEGWELIGVKTLSNQINGNLKGTRELRMVTSQVITTNTDISYKNIVKNLNYTKTEKYIDEFKKEQTISTTGNIDYNIQSEEIKVVQED